MAEASDSTTTPVIPFPSDRARRPDPLGRVIDDWTRARCASNVISVFGSSPDQIAHVVRELVVEADSFNPISRVLEETAFAIGMLRGAVAELVAFDAQLSSAADRLLAEAGL